MEEHWRSVRVFISSTFRDTHGERDLLTRKVFPRLRAWASTRLIDIVEIDLRWGVTEEESASGQAIQLCLSEIDRCNVFVGLLGSRYGWTPDTYVVPNETQYDWVREYPGGRSITELEICRAALNPEETRSVAIKQSVFFFRSPEFLPDVPEKHKPTFVDGATRRQEGRVVFDAEPAKASKLDDLKEMIRARSKEDRRITVGDSGYASVFDADRVELMGRGKVFVSGLERFGDSVFARLQGAISKIYPPSMKVYNPLVLQRIRHSAFAALHSCHMKGRDEIASEIVDRLCAKSDGNKAALVLSGTPGIGKTAVMSDVVQKLEEKLQRQLKNSSVWGALQRKREEEARRRARARRRANRAAAAAEDADGKEKGKGRRGKGRSASKEEEEDKGEFREPTTVVPGLSIVCHLVGSTNRSDEVRPLLTRMVLELRDTVRSVTELQELAGRYSNSSILDRTSEGQWCKGNDKPPADIPELRTLFLKLLPIVCSMTHLIIIIDGLDLTTRKSTKSPLSWLPQLKPAMKNLTLLLSANVVTEFNPEDVALDILLKRGAENIGLNPLLLEEAEAIVTDKLATFGKKLDEKQMKQFLGKREATLPLYVYVAVEELRMFEIYEQVMARIKDLPPTLDGLFAQVLERLEEDHGTNFVRDAVCLLYVSPEGLTEEELRAMLHVTSKSWGMLRLALDPYLQHTEVAGSQPRLTFNASAVFDDAVQRRYLSLSAGPLPLPTPTPSWKSPGRLPPPSRTTELRQAVEVYHTNLALFMTARAFGWSVEASAKEVLLGEARSNFSGVLGDRVDLASTGWSLPGSPEMSPARHAGSPQPSPAPSSFIFPPQLDDSGHHRSVEFSMPQPVKMSGGAGGGGGGRPTGSGGDRRGGYTPYRTSPASVDGRRRVVSRVGNTGKSKKDDYVPGTNGMLSYLQFRHHKAIELPVEAPDLGEDPLNEDTPELLQARGGAGRGGDAGAPTPRRVSHMAEFGSFKGAGAGAGAGAGSSLAKVTEEEEEVDVNALVRLLLEDEAKRAPAKKPKDKYTAGEGGSGEGADGGTESKPTSPKGGKKGRKGESKAPPPRPPTPEEPPKPPSAEAVAAREKLLRVAGLLPDGDGAESQAPSAAETAVVTAGPKVTVGSDPHAQRLGKWCFGDAGAVFGLRMAGYHLWLAECLHESTNVLCDVTYLEAMNRIGCTYDLIDLLHKLQASVSSAAKSALPTSHTMSGSKVAVEYKNAATLGLSRSSRAWLQRLERVTAALEFLQANTKDLATFPHLTFQYAANLPDSSPLTSDAKGLWSLDWENRAHFRWVNKSQKQDPCLMTLRPGAGGDDGPASDGAAAAGGEGSDGARRPVKVNRIAFCGDGSRLAAACSDGRIWVFQSDVGRVVRVLAPLPLEVVAAGGMDPVAARRKCKRHSLPSEPEPPQATAIAFKPSNDQYMISGNSLGQVFMWDLQLAASKEITRPEPVHDSMDSLLGRVSDDLVPAYTLVYSAPEASHEATVTAVAWSKCGTRWLTGDANGVVIAWHVHDKNVMVLSSEVQPIATHRWRAHSGRVRVLRFANQDGWNPEPEPASVVDRFAGTAAGRSLTRHLSGVNGQVPLGLARTADVGRPMTAPGLTSTRPPAPGVMAAHSRSVFPFSGALNTAVATVRPSANLLSSPTPLPVRKKEIHAFRGTLAHARSVTSFTPPGTHSVTRLRKSVARNRLSRKQAARIHSQLAPLRKSYASPMPSVSAAKQRPATVAFASNVSDDRSGASAGGLRLSKSAGGARRRKVAKKVGGGGAFGATPASTPGRGTGSGAAEGKGKESESELESKASAAGGKKGDKGKGEDEALLIITGGGHTMAVWRAGGDDAPGLVQAGRGTGELLAVHVRGDGVQMAVRRTNGVAQLIDTKGAHVGFQEAHGHQIQSVGFSSGNRVAAAFTDHSLRVYTSIDGTRVGVMHGHKGDILDLVYSPDGSILASASADGTVRLWKPQLLDAGSRTSDHMRPVTHTRMSKFVTSAQLFTVDAGGMCKHWRFEDGKPFASTSAAGPHVIQSDFVVIEKRRQNYTVSSTGGIRVWNSNPDSASAPGFKKYAQSLPLSVGVVAPRGQRVAVSRSDDSPVVSLIDTVTGVETHRFFTSCERTAATPPDAELEHPNVTVMVFSPDSRLLLTALETGEVVVWEGGTPNTHRASASRKAKRSKAGGAAAAGAGADGGSAAPSGSGHGRSRAVSRVQSRAQSRVQSRAGSVAGSRPGSVAGSRRGSAHGSTTGSTHGGEAGGASKPGVIGLARAKPWCSEKLFVGLLVDVLATSPSQLKLTKMEFSPDGETLMTLSRGSVIKLWNFGEAVKAFKAGDQDAVLEVGTFTRQCFGHLSRVHDACFSPDGRMLVSASADGTLRTWEAHTSFPLQTFRPHGEAAIRLCRWAATGNRIATFGDDNVVRILDPATGGDIASWVLHKTVTSLDVNPVCTQVTVSDSLGGVRLLQLVTPSGHVDPIPIATVTRMYGAEKHMWEPKLSLRCVYCGHRTKCKAKLTSLATQMRGSVRMFGPRDAFYSDPRMEYQCNACKKPTRANPAIYDNPTNTH